MTTCPNCGQETSGANCQWCSFPLLRRTPVIHRRIQAAGQAKKARQTEEQAKKQAEIEAREKAVGENLPESYGEDIKRMLSLPVGLNQVKHFEEYLDKVESISDDLSAGRIRTEEAMQKFRDISKKVS